jgi:hypothetical protein
MAPSQLAFVAALALSCVTFSNCWGQPNKVLYELQERCGQQAAQTFQKEWGEKLANTEEGQVLANYENHYSPGLNKCFYLEISNTIRRASGKPSSYKTLKLYDLNENKQFGLFQEDTGKKPLCFMRDNPCRSEAEWRRLAKPYLED